MQHVVVIDWETLSELQWNCVAVNLAASHFSFENVDDFEIPSFESLVKESFFVKFDIAEQMKEYNRKHTDSCLAWWKSLPDEVRKQVTRSDNDVTAMQGLESFKSWMEVKGCDSKTTTVWSRGQDFDPVIMRTLVHDVYGYAETDTFLPYRYTMQRDARTWIAAACGDMHKSWLPYKTEGFEQHNARHDVARTMMDVLISQKVLRGEIPKQLQGE